MYVIVWPACMPVYYMYPGGQRRAPDLWNWSCRWLRVPVWMLGTGLGSTAEQ